MIIPDVNVLVYAYRRHAPRHNVYRSWLTALVAGSDELGLTNEILVSVVRVVTNPRMIDTPVSATEAVTFVDSVRAGRRVRWLGASDVVWTEFADIARRDAQVRGNLVPDAWLAALAVAHGARLATADRGFGRFDGLDWFDPAA